MRYRMPKWGVLFSRWDPTETYENITDSDFTQWYDTPQEFLNPIINTDLIATVGYFKPKQLLTILSKCYNNEYIRELHIHGMNEVQIGHYNKFIEKLTAVSDFKPEWLFFITYYKDGWDDATYFGNGGWTLSSNNLTNSAANREQWSTFLEYMRRYYNDFIGNSTARPNSNHLLAFKATNAYYCAFNIVISNFSFRVSGEGATREDAQEELRAPGTTFNIEGEHNHNRNNGSWNLNIISANTSRRRLYRTLNHSANVFSFLGDKKISHKKDFNSPFYGVELELCTDYREREIIDSYNSDDPFFILKSDGSITGSKNFKYELVTLPMSLNAHKVKFAEVFSNLDYDMFDRRTNTNNGMHVHIGMDHFNDKKGSVGHKEKFQFFFLNPSNFKFIVAVSERTVESLQQWSKIPEVRSFSGVTNATQLMKYGRFSADHYSGLNMGSSKPTIEVRIFKGIVSFPTIVKNLEFVDSVFYFTRDTNKVSINLSSYSQWLKAQPKNKYKTLREYYRRIGFSKFVDEATILDYIYSKGYDERSITKTLQEMDGNRIVFDSAMANSVVKSLNRVITSGIKLVFNKRTGKFETDRRHMAELSDLDTTLERMFFKKDGNNKKPDVITSNAQEETPDWLVDDSELDVAEPTGPEPSVIHSESSMIASTRTNPPRDMRYAIREIAGMRCYRATNGWLYRCDTGRFA